MIMKEIKFVDVGEGITEGHIQKWLVNDGDAVKEDQTIFEVETDKAVVSMPSPIDGFVKIFAKAGTTVHLGDMIAQIGTKEEDLDHKCSSTAAAGSTANPAETAGSAKGGSSSCYIRASIAAAEGDTSSTVCPEACKRHEY